MTCQKRPFPLFLCRCWLYVIAVIAIAIYNSIITYHIMRSDWIDPWCLFGSAQASHSLEQAQKNSPELGCVPVSLWVDMSRLYIILIYFDNLDIHILRTLFWWFPLFFDILCSSFDGRWATFVKTMPCIPSWQSRRWVQSSDTAWQGELAQSKHQCNQQWNDTLRTQ